MTTSTLNQGIKKCILKRGSEKRIFEDNSKVTFHFSAKISGNTSEEDLDDSRKIGKPMELILGKQFKLPVWETCLKSMQIEEVSSFIVNRNLVESYPMVSSGYRKFSGVTKSTDQEHRCCGMNALKKSAHLDKVQNLLTDPKDLEFTFELLSVEAPGEYEQEAWSMNPEEKMSSVPLLKDEGNYLFSKKDYKGASLKYGEALGRLEHLLLREKPGDKEWVAIEKMKIPLLLNYSQCKLFEKDFYAVLQHTTTVLQKEPDNVKALFRRAKAQVGAWNPEEARLDFQRVKELDPTLSTAVLKELKDLHEMERQKDQKDRASLKGKIF